MNAPYISKHFALEELLPRALHARLANANRLHIGWLLMDERILRAADALRATFGPLTCNDWHRAGLRDASGLRITGQRDYSETSQHSFGRALDLVSHSYTAEELRQGIKHDPDNFPTVTRVEAGVSWLHIDCANAPTLTFFTA